ncbi:MAG: NapC/NirT family cytochrome c [Chloroflexi bacterium]|nr:NapC/NirT family cytochrome c [Chloroflexota bacterium]
MKKFLNWLKRLFFPPSNAPLSIRILPYAILGILTIAVLISGAYGWQYTNSPSFCGTACHTMPPEYAAYQVSPHAQIACVECHIGREFIGNQIFRKAGDIKHLIANTFKTYEYPIMATSMRPARETCETCHSPEKFSDDSLRLITHFTSDLNNTPYSIYLVLKTGGGSKRSGLGRGIHWHIENKVYFYATDASQQNIPYVRVVNDDGSVVEYSDISANFDPASMDENQLLEMDCITCHNRITHRIYTPEESLDISMSIGAISTSIPNIRSKGVEVLRGTYATQEEALAGIAKLEDYYKTSFPDFYTANTETVQSAIAELQNIFNESVFIDQKVDWNAHQNNIGHIDSAGCFRCHDGKHLNSEQEAIRLECNLCHSIPVMAAAQDLVTSIEISRGPEPNSHLNPNWINLHHSAFDSTCSNCHSTDNPGGTTNTSFCSNSACHGTVFTYAGFDAPNLRTILQAQLPTPAPVPTPVPVIGTPTFAANIQPIFAARCTMCHSGASAQAGLDLSIYAGVMQGSKNGVVIVPGDSAGSKLIQVQSVQHKANLSAEELELVKQWIDANAPER